MKLPAIMSVAVVFQSCFAIPNLAQNELPSESLKWKPKGMMNDLFWEHHLRLNKSHGAEPRRLLGFSWKTCNKTASLVDVKTLSITPDPLSFPGQITIATDFIIRKPLQAPLKAAVDMQVKLGPDYISVPCVENIGSCTYNDVCELLKPIADQCPDPLKKIHINCQCPFKANSYSLQKTSFQINTSIELKGDYRVQADVTHGSDQVLCLEIELSVK